MKLKYKKPDANYIKTLVIDYLLKETNFSLIVSEMPFFKGARRADLFAINGNSIYGFEIKSKYDSLLNLNSQINDYLKVCNKVYVVVADKFKNDNVINNLSKKIGIIFFSEKIFNSKNHKKIMTCSCDNVFSDSENNNFLIVKRKAKLMKILDKKALVDFLWKRDLEDIYKSYSLLSYGELRDKILKEFTLKKINNIVLSVLIKRYENSYKIFLQERGAFTCIEDLYTITGIKNSLEIVFSNK